MATAPEASAARNRVEARRANAILQLDMIEIDTEIHQRVDTAFSCLTFMLVGIPLGLMAKRGNMLVGFALSFLVVLFVYYPLVLAGQVLVFDKYFAIAPSIWAANAVMFVLGAVMLAMAFRR